MYSFYRRVTISAVGLALALALSGCSSDFGKSRKADPFAGKGSPYYRGSGPLPRGGGRHHIGKPYQVAGVWFTPRAQPGYDKTGIASWYGEAFHRRQTSNGEYFDMGMLSAAHATLPLPSYAKVTNLENGNTVVVRINDRGPFVDTRLIDLSKRAAEVLGFKQKGMAKVRVQYLGPAPLNDQGPHLAMMNNRLRRGDDVRTLVAAAQTIPEQSAQAAVGQDTTTEAEYELTSVAAAPVRKVKPGYVVRVATFENLANAEAARDELSTLGQARVIGIEGASGELYLLQLGPFRSELTAQNAMDAAIESGFTRSHILAVRIQAAAAKP
jgi:rare lipoprotein A